MQKNCSLYSVNSDIESYTSRTAKIKMVMLPSNTWPNVSVLLSNES